MSSLSKLPQIEKLLQSEEMLAWFPRLSRPLVARLAAAAVGEAKEKILKGEAFSGTDAVLQAAARLCRETARRRISRLINATGIALHTNLGRAPISTAAWRGAEMANTNYSNLEFDLKGGKRGNRCGIVPELLSLLVGSEDALVLNNNAAAVFLILSCLAKGKEVIVSRGEQVQIGGGFRIPDILAHTGAKMVEIGTTNITRLEDYTEAVNPDTAMVLVVHTSNYRIRGFTSMPSIGELAESLPKHVTLAVDQGSGATTERLPGEMPVARYLDSGAHLVSFSGDKLLGGPQAGLIVGRKDLIRNLSKHPLNRVFRPGKTVYSLMEETLVVRLNRNGANSVEVFLGCSLEELRERGESLLAGLPDEGVRLIDSTAATGGGSAPDEHFPSLSIELDNGDKPQDLLSALRNLDIPIIGTIEDGKVHLNLATLLPGDLPIVREALRRLL